MNMKQWMLGAATVVMCAAASAGSSSSSSDSPGNSGFVPVNMAQRVMHFGAGRIWQRADGVVLVCPLNEETERCKRNQRSIKSWVDVHSLSIEGHRISGVQFFFAGQNGEQQLMVFFAKDNPLSAAAAKR
jgi:hypothetical protein